MSEMVPLGALNDEGVDALRSHIKRMSEESDLKPVSEICSDSSLVEPVSGDCVVDAAAHFGTKLEFAVYLRDVLSPVDERDLKTRAGLWTWLACVYLHMLCDRRPDGSWSTREMARYIMDSDFQRYYRHGVAGPWMILESAKGDTELAQLMLYGPVNHTNDFIGQLASRQEVLRNPAVLDAARLLYWDEETGRPKRGASARGQESAGTLRRFTDLLQQLDLTYDLYALDGAAIVGLLPTEFDRWAGRGD